MDSENFIEELKPYGILAKGNRRFCSFGTKIKISYATIESIDFDALQEKGIKELSIVFSKILNIKFSNQNDVEIHFESCDFLNQVFAYECHFEKEVEFVGCNFQKEVSFYKATFRTIANFYKATFRTIANFYKATFRTIANFYKAIFQKEANFDKATFQMRVIFNGAIFQNKVIFFNAKFLAKQEDNEIIENSFENVTFEKEVFFNGTSFQTIVSFYKATFKDTVSFEEVSFQAKVSFNKAIFQDKVIFFNAKFLAKQEGNQIIKNSLKKVTFKKQIDFSNCQFLKEVDFKNNEFYEAYFKMSKFKDNVYFNNSYFKDYADFHECEFEKNACFYGVKFEKVPNFSQAIFKGNLNAVNANLNFDFEDLEKKINQECEEFNKNKKEQDKKSLDKFANDFRDSFRVFKNVLIKDNNSLDASNFHKCELYCKEIELNSKKPKKFSKEWLDKYQLMFYRNLCEHHTDLILNLRWLIAIVGFFASILFVLKYGNGNLSEFFNKDNDLLKVLKNILNVKALNDSNAVYLIFMYSVIGLLFVRTFFILYYAVICFFYITISSFNLFQIVSFTFKSHKDCLENITIFLYIFCISLVVFSLQKTARKNSIVPS
ncbi:pentapeptide repeat-containing protein [Campylobacter sp. B0100352/1]|nr:pentapeptide repeat-containing protein [Campylobacter sp. B0100352/1]